MENDKELIFRFSKIVRDNFNSSEEIMVEAQKVINDIRQDTLRQVLPDIMETPSAYPWEGVSAGHNQCREDIIDKAKEIWGIDLSKD
jgi:hypothetical protein